MLTPEDRVELLDGPIYLTSPIGSDHPACVRRLVRLFQVRAEPHSLVSVPNPIRLDQTSEPELDLALLTPCDDEYPSPHPRADEVLLVVEVADSSLTLDQETKLPPVPGLVFPPTANPKPIHTPSTERSPQR